MAKKPKPWNERIKDLQKALDYTSEQMAEALGVSTDALHTWKYRKGRLPTKPVQKLIELLEERLDGK